jgi:Ser/Thr protein kinase RdoA (MazF antagonist)
MTEALPASHSILCTTSLSSYVERHYDIGQVSECKFLNRGLNDTYLVKTSERKFILRVYHLNWRTKSDVAYELEVIAHLARKGVSVSEALVRKDESFSATIVAPEGERFIALFTFAKGDPPNYEEEEEQQAYLYGKSVAQVHIHTESFASKHQRFDLSLETLLDQSLKEIEPLLSHRPDDWKYLLELSKKLSDAIQDMHVTNALEQGFCHGDFHGWNAHVDETHQLTFFDFDCCGKGWRAYDIATFFWGARIRDKHKKRCPHFLRGYTDVRQLSDADLASIPYFVAVRHIWLVGVLVANGGDLGFGWMDDKYMDRQIWLWREMESECFDKTMYETYPQ